MLHNLSSCRAEIEGLSKTERLIISTRLVEPLKAQPGAVIQVIGELEISPSDPARFILLAEIVRLMDPMDLEIYYKAMDSQNEYLRTDRLKSSD